MTTSYPPLLSNAKKKIDSIICLLIALEHCGSSLDETVLEGAISGVRMLASDAYCNMDSAEKYINSSKAKEVSNENSN
ncbi:hypothetical protein I5420_03455 [Citrobacter koseri]|uniref:hypothetical protein n=1 Tax=Citrobacter koseri TaxID=545 RepID=UPI0019043D9C|nr:hypothetical protein [Citrobacter koseri]MBJ8842786.1 hypothetical protein [Citrobacter koseri]MBJ8914910.1 hypothetical protein [Citrobacter koseri]HBC5084011.1 hypothetical protein [Citrobacter koseri]HCT2059603.1 hypothetical protein [Citrobacter koseri]